MNVRKKLTKIGIDTYGPKARNPIYGFSWQGRAWRIQRKRWELPCGWGWQAECATTKEIKYGDTLEEVLFEITGGEE